MYMKIVYVVICMPGRKLGQDSSKIKMWTLQKLVANDSKLLLHLLLSVSVHEFSFRYYFTPLVSVFLLTSYSLTAGAMVMP